MVRHAVGFGIVDEAHGDGIEMELASKPDGYVREMDENVGAVAVHFVEAELLACADGHVEVADLRLQFGKVFELCRPRGRLRAEPSV